MRSSLVKSAVLAAGFLASSGLPGLEPRMRPVPDLMYSMTELKAGDNGHFVTTALINNNRITVLVDTGASAVGMSFEDAEAAGVHPRSLDYKIPVSTANGVVMAAEVVLRRVEVDGVGVDDVRGMVLPKGAFNGTLLGMSFLSKLRSFSVEDGVLTLKN